MIIPNNNDRLYLATVGDNPNNGKSRVMLTPIIGWRHENDEIFPVTLLGHGLSGRISGEFVIYAEENEFVQDQWWSSGGASAAGYKSLIEYMGCG